MSRAIELGEVVDLLEDAQKHEITRYLGEEVLGAKGEPLYTRSTRIKSKIREAIKRLSKLESELPP